MILHIGNGVDCARDHAICEGPMIVARVTGAGYPIGTGWAPESAAMAQRLVACWNACESMVDPAAEIARLRECERRLHQVSGTTARLIQRMDATLFPDGAEDQ